MTEGGGKDRNMATAIAIAINEERIARLEQRLDNEQEWRRETLKEICDGFARLDAKVNWLIGSLIALLIAIIARNWLG